MRREQSAHPAASVYDPVNPREQAILELYRALDDEDQRAVQALALEKKRLRDVEMQLKELSAAIAALNRSP